MATPKGHKIVTVPRGDGYAARCEVERDGTAHLCDITFGGFESRTDARNAIRHEQVGAMAETPNHPNGGL